MTDDFIRISHNLNSIFFKAAFQQHGRCTISEYLICSFLYHYYHSEVSKMYVSGRLKIFLAAFWRILFRQVLLRANNLRLFPQSNTRAQLLFAKFWRVKCYDLCLWSSRKLFTSIVCSLLLISQIGVPRIVCAQLDWPKPKPSFCICLPFHFVRSNYTLKTRTKLIRIISAIYSD